VTAEPKRLSASQVKLFGRCQRRWAFEYLEGRKTTAGKGAELGSAVHKELEDWLLHSKPPETRIAMAFLPHTPAPGIPKVETAITFATTNAAWRGFIDVLYTVGPAPYAESGDVVIHDHKTTSALSYALTPEGLAVDAQANLYAYWAYLQGARTVTAKWVYVQTKGATRAQPVELTFERHRVEAVVGLLDEAGAVATRLYQLRPKTSDVPANTTDCYSYGQRCPHYEDCKPERTLALKMPTGEPETMSEAFKASLTSSFPKSAPPLPAKAPALPATAKKAPPPLPKGPTPGAVESIAAQFAAITGSLTQLVDAEPVVESGFMNSPEAPVEPAVSPEDAVVKQQIAPPPPPPKDDLDDMTDEQLKELGMALGAFDKSNKARRPGRIGMIRAKRMELGSAAPTAAIAEERTEGWAAVEAAGGLSENTAQKSGAESEIGISTGLNVLYLNCAPSYGGLTLPELLETLRPAFKAATGADDYRLVEYGKGAGAMSVGLREHFAAHYVNELVVDTRTQEGMAFASTLAAVAANVIRGF
jgi:hypothetical protein